MTCAKPHGPLTGFRGTIRLRSEKARALLAAAMASCKHCRWLGTHEAAKDCTPTGVLAELYVSAVEHTVLSAVAEGKQVGRVFTMHSIRPGGRLCWPPTPDAWKQAWVTFDRGHVGVQMGPVLDHLAELTGQERAWVADDCLDILVGGEFYPEDAIRAVQDRHLAAV